ncbi:MAG: DEAD/DEAH box helicase [Acidobacteriota bacterium]
MPQDSVETTDLSFDDLDLSPDIRNAIREVGFEHPTPIQAQAIPYALDDYDVIGLAETGSGKTAAFVIPMAETLREGRGIRGLILCPTREIALQTKAFIDALGAKQELSSVCIIGGVRMGPQITDLRRKPDIVVATPGRLFDHMGRGNISLKDIEMLVLDEADHMLDLGFLPQILKILEEIPEDRHTMMFSATMPPPIERLAQRFLFEPELVDIRPKGRTAEGIEHRIYLVATKDKMKALQALLNEEKGSTLIFIRRKVDAEWASRRLERDGFQVQRIHSNLSQGQRVAALKGLREGQHRILVATDIAARGIDIPVIEHIINFTLPETVQDYVHRAGRTARGNASGIVSTIGTWQDKMMVREIERAIGQTLVRHEVEGVESYQERRKTIKGRERVRRRLL